MKNYILILFCILFLGCKAKPSKNLGHSPLSNTKKTRSTLKNNVKTSALQPKKSGIKIFNQCDPNCIWQYYYPFTDTSYLVAIQNCPEEYLRNGKNAVLYFGKNKGNVDEIFQKDSLFIKIQHDFVELKDFNGDNIKDLLIFSETGARGVNSFYYLYLIDSKKKKLIKVKNFENIVNPEYNKEHQVIIAYGFSGVNNYSIYKISRGNIVHQIGESFEDDFESDENELNYRINQILKRNK